MIEVVLVMAIIGAVVVLIYKLDRLHDLMNSRLDELLKITARVSHQAGVEQERKEEHARQDARVL